MSCLDDLVHLNNLGIVRIQYGMFDEAARVFRDALCIVYNADSCGDSPQASKHQASPSELITGLHVDETDDLLSTSYLSQDCDKKSDVVALSREFFSDHNTLIPHKSAFLFFNNCNVPFVQDRDAMDVCEEEGTCSPLLRKKTISAILLFNLALSYHLRAIRLNSSASPEHAQHLRRAQALYGMAEQVLLQSSTECCSKEDCCMTEPRVLLAIYNNKACISFHFWNISECESQLIALRYLLANGLQRDGDEQVVSEDDENVRHFFWNAISLAKLAMTAPAA